eukprot:CAMPEP_0198154610 /NCGR_PEP_ID=MMETSP1443-20131203/68686_1 /TAXON_ID=186043 /ORGANISM="Entomoneis sp., Strain CCMP2396" /LENGTH=210 /DNA_ID=CAMNT_0043821291 /DNA_START=896 /DNA_END=1528 /DNA_ORIENTATION=+
MRQSKVILCPPPDDDEEVETSSLQQSYQQGDANRGDDDDGFSLQHQVPNNNNISLLSQPLQQNFDVLKKRKVSHDESNRIAEETAAMIRAEVRRMQNAVAELEVYLHNVENQGVASDDVDQESDNSDREGRENHNAGVQDNAAAAANDVVQMQGRAAAAMVRDDDLVVERRPRRRRQQQHEHQHRFPALPDVVVIEAPVGDAEVAPEAPI